MVPRVLLGIAVAAALIGYVQVGPSHAVPAFARSYDMQCNACHTRPPRLDRFGEQFHMMGFQIPSASRPDGIVGSLKEDGSRSSSDQVMYNTTGAPGADFHAMFDDVVLAQAGFFRENEGFNTYGMLRYDILDRGELTFNISALRIGPSTSSASGTRGARSTRTDSRRSSVIFAEEGRP